MARKPAAAVKAAESPVAPAEGEKPADVVPVTTDAAETDPRADLGELVHSQDVSDEDAARLKGALAARSSDTDASDSAAIAAELGDLDAPEREFVSDFARGLTWLTVTERATLSALLVKMGAPAGVIATIGEAPDIVAAIDGGDRAALFAPGGRVMIASTSPAGRRRAGFAFTKTAIPVAVDDLSPDQVAALIGDPTLTIAAG